MYYERDHKKIFTREKMYGTIIIMADCGVLDFYIRNNLFGESQ